MRKVKAIQDEDCHWYVIPNEFIEEFRKDEENEEMIDTGKFTEKWGKYMTGGDLNNIQLWAEI